jgi:hypothetical protein
VSARSVRAASLSGATLAEPAARWATAATPDVAPNGELLFRAPAAAYSGIPCWRSAKSWLGAAKLHPSLVEECRATNVRVETFLAVLPELGRRADVATGRNIMASHSEIGAAIGRSGKTVQRSCRIAERLGLLVLVLRGCDMSLDQRQAVLGHYTRGTRGWRWRNLPNYYAATMPVSLAKLTRQPGTPKPVRGSSYASSFSRPVDNDAPSFRVVHLPVGSNVPAQSSFSYDSTTFKPDCGQPAHTARPKPHTPPASRARRAHQRTELTAAQLAAASPVRGWAKELSGQLLGFWNVPLRRISNGLQKYFTAGLSPADIIDGLNRYLAAQGITWLTNWGPGTGEQQARYLVGMINRAAAAGYIESPPP